MRSWIPSRFDPKNDGNLIIFQDIYFSNFRGPGNRQIFELPSPSCVNYSRGSSDFERVLFSLCTKSLERLKSNASSHRFRDINGEKKMTSNKYIKVTEYYFRNSTFDGKYQNL